MLYESVYYGVQDFGGDYLAHYQVKGAKHGVRRYQYADGSLTPLGRIHYGVGKSRRKAKTNVLKNSTQGGKQLGIFKKRPTKVSVPVMSSKTVKADDSKAFKKIEGFHSRKMDMQMVNPHVNDPDAMQKGYHDNCVACSVAIELRARGYDVEALPNSPEHTRYTLSDMVKAFGKDPHKEPMFYDYERLKKTFESFPDGSRGVFCAGVEVNDKKEQSYHEMAWEKYNGQLVVLDAQINMFLNGLEGAKVAVKTKYPFHVLRTDNAEINWEYMRKFVKERD